MFLVELADMLGALNGLTEARLGCSVAELWAERSKEMAPVTNADLYEFAAKRELKTIRERLQTLAAEESDLAGQARAIIASLLSLAAPHGLAFSDLNDFARLRSQVARHALANAGS
jgi:hypothetical protein